jgi:hypothetical protein
MAQSVAMLRMLSKVIRSFESVLAIVVMAILALVPPGINRTFGAAHLQLQRSSVSYISSKKKKKLTATPSKRVGG